LLLLVDRLPSRLASLASVRLPLAVLSPLLCDLLLSLPTRDGIFQSCRLPLASLRPGQRDRPVDRLIDDFVLDGLPWRRRGREHGGDVGDGAGGFGPRRCRLWQ
jgi:hypothetical protein